MPMIMVMMVIIVVMTVMMIVVMIVIVRVMFMIVIMIVPLIVTLLLMTLLLIVIVLLMTLLLTVIVIFSQGHYRKQQSTCYRADEREFANHLVSLCCVTTNDSGCDHNATSSNNGGDDKRRFPSLLSTKPNGIGKRTPPEADARLVNTARHANYIFLAAQVVVLASHMPPALWHSALLFAAVTSPAKAGPVNASARVTANIEIRVFMTLSPLRWY